MKKLVSGLAGSLACSLLLAGCGGNVSWSATSNPLVAGPGVSELPDLDTVAASDEEVETVPAASSAGSSRDQLIAARGSVLAVVSVAGGHLRADVSLDGGATFPIQETLDTTEGFRRLGFIECVVAPDYTIACVYRKTTGSVGASRDVLWRVEATPTGLDGKGTPAGYGFALPFVVEER